MFYILYEYLKIEIKVKSKGIIRPFTDASYKFLNQKK